MSILVNSDTRLLVQGITGREGEFHARQMMDYGTKVVAGVTPGKGGQTVAGVPVFDTVREAVEATGANATIIFVPAAFAADAIWRPPTPGCPWWSASPKASPPWTWSASTHRVKQRAPG